MEGGEGEEGTKKLVTVSDFLLDLNDVTTGTCSWFIRSLNRLAKNSSPNLYGLLLLLALLANPVFATFLSYSYELPLVSSSLLLWCFRKGFKLFLALVSLSLSESSLSLMPDNLSKLGRDGFCFLGASPTLPTLSTVGRSSSKVTLTRLQLAYSFLEVIKSFLRMIGGLGGILGGVSSVFSGMAGTAAKPGATLGLKLLDPLALKTSSTPS